MEMKELREKTEEELKKVLSESQGKLVDCRFRTAAGQQKDTREGRRVRRTIARILTLLRSRVS
ncbi:MAG: 50S ribosomal protein L29 [Patescibacteria group bacterium]